MRSRELAKKVEGEKGINRTLVRTLRSDIFGSLLSFVGLSDKIRRRLTREKSRMLMERGKEGERRRTI